MENLWVQASLEQRQRFQQLLFPDGIAFDGNCFVSNRRERTGFQLLAGNQAKNEGLVAPSAIMAIAPGGPGLDLSLPDPSARDRQQRWENGL